MCICLCLRCLWITERSASSVEPLPNREHVTGVETVVLGYEYINLACRSLCSVEAAFQQKVKMKYDLLMSFKLFLLKEQYLTLVSLPV